MIPDWLLTLILAAFSLIAGGVGFYFWREGGKTAGLWIWFAAGVLLLLWVTLQIQKGILTGRNLADTAVFHGRLVPANEETPNVPVDAWVLMLGDSLQVRTRTASNLRVFTKNGRPFLKLRVVDGQLLVSASVIDSKGDRIVQIVDNEFQASQERAFNPKQPDPSTLVVRDCDGVEVLNIRYVNPRVIRIVGRFCLPGYDAPVEILAADGIRWPGGGGLSSMTLEMAGGGKGSVIAF